MRDVGSGAMRTGDDVRVSGTSSTGYEGLFPLGFPPIVRPRELAHMMTRPSRRMQWRMPADTREAVMFLAHETCIS